MAGIVSAAVVAERSAGAVERWRTFMNSAGEHQRLDEANIKDCLLLEHHVGVWHGEVTECHTRVQVAPVLHCRLRGCVKFSLF